MLQFLFIQCEQTKLKNGWMGGGNPGINTTDIGLLMISHQFR